jgi:hypothetical protein
MQINVYLHICSRGQFPEFFQLQCTVLGVGVGESAVEEWKWLFVNECAFKSPICTVIEFLSILQMR